MKTHVYRSAAAAWQPHPTLSGIRIKSLENQKTWREASVTLVEVERGGFIEQHLHELNYESAYILAGEGVLSVPEGNIALSTGDGVTVPPQTLHALRNTGPDTMRILAVHIPPLL
jgi:quercetin dioxygenase-like cupin family protein